MGNRTWSRWKSDCDSTRKIRPVVCHCLSFKAMKNRHFWQNYLKAGMALYLIPVRGPIRRLHWQTDWQGLQYLLWRYTFPMSLRENLFDSTPIVLPMRGGLSRDLDSSGIAWPLKDFCANWKQSKCQQNQFLMSS